MNALQLFVFYALFVCFVGASAMSNIESDVSSVLHKSLSSVTLDLDEYVIRIGEVPKRPPYPTSREYFQFSRALGYGTYTLSTLALFEELFSIDSGGKIVRISPTITDRYISTVIDDVFYYRLVECFIETPLSEYDSGYNDLKPWLAPLQDQLAVRFRAQPFRSFHSLSITILECFRISMKIRGGSIYDVKEILVQTIDGITDYTDKERDLLLSALDWKRPTPKPSLTYMWYNSHLIYTPLFSNDIHSALRPHLDALLFTLQKY